MLLLLVAQVTVGQDLAGYGAPAEYGVPGPESSLGGLEPVEAEEDLDGSAGNGGGGHSHGDGSDPLAWLREAIPGEPEVDYPIYNTAPETSFTCSDKGDGMFADIEAQCQAWHQCLADRMWTFLCPNGTIFSQELFTCVWWFDFDCESAEEFYSLNENLYETAGVTGEGTDSGYTDNSSGQGGQGGQGSLGPLEPVVSEDYDEEEDYEEELTGYGEELAGYGEEVTVAGPTPVPVTELPSLYGAPTATRQRTGRRLRKGGRTRLRKRKPDGSK